MDATKKPKPRCVQRNIYIDIETLAKMEELARKLDRNVSYVARDILSGHFAQMAAPESR
jgi:predicted transcriptional regulator